MKVPKNLKVKVGSKEESEWTIIRNNAREDVDKLKRQVMMNTAILELADRMIKVEKENFK